MLKTAFILLTLAAGTILSRAESADRYSTIGQPSIFWHDGEWQVFQDGRWVPYATTKSAPLMEVEPGPEPTLLPEPQPQVVDTNGVYYDWGYGLPLLRPMHHHHRFDKNRQFKRDNDSGRKSLTDTAIGNMGRTTIGIGKQGGGLGQTTIGIGQPSGGIGQTTVGIGQPTIGIGQQTRAVETHSHGQSEHSQSHR